MAICFTFMPMDAKKFFQALFTGANVGEAFQNAEGRILDPSIALAAAFSRRFSDEDSFEKTLDSKIFLSRKDFPSLKEREVVRFPSGKNMLCGYLYRVDLAKGLLIYVHGIKGQADDYYAIGEDYFVRMGYDVFAIDLTASGRSQGMGIDGLHQSALDVKAAYEYILSRGDFDAMPKYLFGHSWGAYGVGASLNFPAVRPNAIAVLSGFDTPLKEMLGLPASKIGFEVDFGKEELEAALKARCGEYYDLSASKGIRNSKVPAIVLHGDNDTTVPMKASIFGALNEDEATKVLIPSRGHADVFLCDESVAYANDVRGMGKVMTDVYGKDVTQIPKGMMDSFLSTFDRRMTSLINVKVFEKIVGFFDAHR